MEKPADLNDATMLYEAIGKYIPKTSELPEDIYDFIGKIIGNIREKNDYQAYLNAIQIMTGVTFNVLKESTSDEILDLFIHGLMEWRIIELVEFFSFKV
jgi:hypothetical protein